MENGFKRATRQQSRLHLALVGPAGAGKTMSAIRIAQGLGGPIAFIDTERGSGSMYSDVTEYDVLSLDSFHPQRYIDAIKMAEDAGYNVIIIDSLSHAWAGKDGLLEFVDKRKAQTRGNDFGVWRDATPLQNALVDAILGSKCHVIATMRSKMEYVLEKDERTGKQVPRKVGLQPVQRDQIEFEFSLVADLDVDHKMIVTKSRIASFADEVILKPGPEVGQRLAQWLLEGDPAPEPVPAPEFKKQEPEPQQETAAPKGRAAGRAAMAAIPANVWDGAPQWQLDAKAQLDAWGVKFSEIPQLMAIREAMGSATAPQVLTRFADTVEGDPFDALMAIARPAQEKEEATA